MSMTTTLIAVVAIVSVGAIALGVMRTKPAKGGGAETFKRKALLTANELEFLGRLEAAMPELRFCPQVAMGALLEPTAPKSDRSAYARQRGMFSQKIIDFVAQRRDDNAIVAIIELDDKTHDSAKDARRDTMLASAGYKIVRWTSKSKPDAAAIRAALGAARATAPGKDQSTGPSP